MSSSLPLIFRPSLGNNTVSHCPRLRSLYSPSFASIRFPILKHRPTRLSLGFSPRIGGGFLSCASQNGEGETDSMDSFTDEAEEARGQSTLPERFRHLTKEVPERPIRWPWLIVLAFLIYAWRSVLWELKKWKKAIVTIIHFLRYLLKLTLAITFHSVVLAFLIYVWRSVLWELTNWKKALFTIFRFLRYLSKLALAFAFHFVGDYITAFIRYIEFSLYFIRSIYASIVAFAPVPELTTIILLTSAVLSIAEVTVPDSVSGQPYLLTAAGLIGFGAVRGYIPELPFWFLLSGLFSYSRFVKKRDGVSAALPSVAVLTAVGEPWVRGLVMAGYLALAIIQHSKSPKGDTKTEIQASSRRLPLPLFLAALAIGIHVAAKWIRCRHLTWMVV